LFILKAIRPDKCVQGIQAFITDKMGKQFVEPPTLDISKCFADSRNTMPLIFILSAGSDPMEDFIRFANNQGMGSKFRNISLGQG